MPNRPRGLAALAVLVIAVSSAACSAGDPVAPLLGDRNEDGIVRIACLGDSNTQRPQDGDTWCELLEDLADLPEPTRTFNAGVGGAMIQPTVRELPNPPESYRGAAGSGTWAIFDGHGQLGFALEQPGALDYAVAAFGTNDLRAGADSDLPAQTDPAAIVRWYQVLRERAAREDVLLLVARTPPVLDETRSLMTDTVDIPGAASGAIQALNDLIDERFPPEVVIDFRSFRESGMLPSPSSFVDRLHLSPKAHRHRAEEALARLRSLRSLERYAFTFRLPAPEADGGERLDAAQLHPPRLISSSIPLPPTEATSPPSA
jgi:lysophospholipase L1-like esterase